MSKKSPNTLFYVLVRQGLISWKSAFVIISLAVFLGIIGNSATIVLASIIELRMSDPSTPFPVANLILLAVSTLVMFLFVWTVLAAMARRYHEASVPIVSLDDGPPPKVLILFVSNPPQFLSPKWSNTAIEPKTNTGEPYGIHMKPSEFPVPDDLRETVERIGSDFTSWDRTAISNTPENLYYKSWRMPVEAIEALRNKEHVGGRLERIVLIPSADVFLPGYGPETALNGAGPKGWKPGTYRSADKLKGLIQELLGQDSAIKIDVLSDVLRKDTVLANGLKSPVLHGIPFGDIEAVAITLDRLWHFFTNRHSDTCYTDEEIVVDTTGGLAITSVAAAAYTLKHPRRRMIYVDPNSYDTKSYNVIHNLDDIIAEAQDK